MNKRRQKRNRSASPGEPATRPDQWLALTGLRGLAAFAVVCLHAFEVAGKPVSVPQPLAWLFATGWSGVDIFFTLSAFLLTMPFVAARLDQAPAPGLREYARRRVLRILPAYYTQIAVLLALGAIGVGDAIAWKSPTPPEVFAHLVFYLGAWPLVLPHLPPWWTLPVEMGFYLLLPLFARCLRPGRWPWLLLAIAASLAYRFWLMHAGLTRVQEVFWADGLPGRLHQFLVGMLAAYAFVQLKRSTSLPSARMADMLALAVSIVFLVLPALGFLSGDHAFEGGPIKDPLLLCWHLFASLAVAVLLVALASGAPKLGRVFAWAPLQLLGLISYSLYLWHYPLMLLLRAEMGGYGAIRADFWPFYFYSVLFSVALAGASWWMIERPVQLWGRQSKASGTSG